MKHARPVPPVSPPRAVGVLISSFYHPYVEAAAKGVQTSVTARSGRVIFFVGGELENPHRDHIANNRVFTLARSRSVDGIIAVSPSINPYVSDAQYSAFLDMFRGTPLVSLGETASTVPSVRIDNYTGMYDLVTHLIEKHGRRCLALLRGPAHNDDARARFAAYRDALESHGLPYNPRLVTTGPFYVDSGQAAVAEFLDRRRVRFDAFLGSNDTTAIAAMGELRRRGFRIPADVLVTGFDDMGEATRVRPRLTTVSQPCFEAGRQAADTLYDLMEGRADCTAPSVPCRLTARESCGCGSNGSRQGTAGRAERAGPHGAAALPDLAVNSAMFDMNLLSYNERVCSVSSRDDLQDLVQTAMPRFSVRSCHIFSGGNRDDASPFDACRLLAGFPPLPSPPDGAGKPVRGGDIPSLAVPLRDGATGIILPLWSRDERVGLIRFGVDPETFIHAADYGKNFGLVCENLSAGLGVVIHALDEGREPARSGPPAVRRPAGRRAVPLSEARIREIYKTLVTHMEREKPYVDETLSLHRLSENLGIPRNYISAAIHRFCGANFYQFIFRYRVREARKLMAKQPRRPLSMIDVAYQCGFRSKSTFNKVFKLRTGMTPTGFLSCQAKR